MTDTVYAIKWDDGTYIGENSWKEDRLSKAKTYTTRAAAESDKDQMDITFEGEGHEYGVVTIEMKEVA